MKKKLDTVVAELSIQSHKKPRKTETDLIETLSPVASNTDNLEDITSIEITKILAEDLSKIADLPKILRDSLSDLADKMGDYIKEKVEDFSEAIDKIYSGFIAKHLDAYKNFVKKETSYLRQMMLSKSADETYETYGAPEPEARVPDEYDVAVEVLEETVYQEIGVRQTDEVHPEKKERFKLFQSFGFNQVLLKFRRLATSYNQVRAQEMGVHPGSSLVYLT